MSDALAITFWFVAPAAIGGVGLTIWYGNPVYLAVWVACAAVWAVGLLTKRRMGR